MQVTKSEAIHEEEKLEVHIVLSNETKIKKKIGCEGKKIGLNTTNFGNSKW